MSYNAVFRCISKQAYVPLNLELLELQLLHGS